MSKTRSTSLDLRAIGHKTHDATAPTAQEMTCRPVHWTHRFCLLRWPVLTSNSQGRVVTNTQFFSRGCARARDFSSSSFPSSFGSLESHLQRRRTRDKIDMGRSRFCPVTTRLLPATLVFARHEHRGPTAHVYYAESRGETTAEGTKTRVRPQEQKKKERR